MDMRKIYENEIIGAGKEVCAFGEEMMIFFGDQAPDTLKDYCYSIPTAKTSAAVKAGQFFSIDDVLFQIKYVGELAEKNLNELGHLTVSFTDTEDARLPGTIVVEKKRLPLVRIGSRIEIFEDDNV